jgi:hypothetical protein
VLEAGAALVVVDGAGRVQDECATGFDHFRT